MDSNASIVAVDVGNTRAKFGRFRIDEAGRLSSVEIVAHLLSDAHDLALAFLQWWQAQDCAQPGTVMVAGSDPDSRDRLIGEWPLQCCNPRVIDSYEQIPVRTDVENPWTVGIDRLLNVFAASRMLQEPAAIIAVDSGTATTVDLMTSDLTFRGGSILPGLRLSAHAMHDYTARLPLLNPDEQPTRLPDLPGRNTEEAMLAGLFIGQLGAVKELSDRLSMAAGLKFGDSRRVQVFLTGGGGRQLVHYLPNATFVDSLALHGLAMLSPDYRFPGTVKSSC